MKTLKISLSVVVIAALILSIVKWYEDMTPPPVPVSAENQYISKVEQAIQQLHEKPDHSFCKDCYSEIAYLIEDYHQNVRLGLTEAENDQWKEILSKNLYSAYAEKFIKQAFYVFNRNDWDFGDLRFIRNEYQTLEGSPMLERNSQVDKKFKEINLIFRHYDEIVRFISINQQFSFSETGLSDRFPIADVRQKINQATRYTKSGLGNSYLNNCTRMHRQLDDLSKIMFNAHVKYLDNKISTWSNMYSNYNSQKTYADNLYRQLESEIEAMDNDVYNASNFSNEYSRLKRKWQADAQDAYNHFNKTAQN